MKIEQFNAAKELMREREDVEKEIEGWEKRLTDPTSLRPFFHHGGSDYNHYGNMRVAVFCDFRSDVIHVLKSRLEHINIELRKL